MANTPLPEFPGNSKMPPKGKTTEDRPQLEKLISGTATVKKKSVWSRIGESFTGDNAQSVGQYIVLDVLIPAFKTMISDAATQGVERMLFGDGRPRSRAGGQYTPYSQYTPYNRGFSSSAQKPPWDTPDDRQLSRRGRAIHDFREIIIPTRQEAGLVLDTLTDYIDRYGTVTVRDFYNATGVSAEYTDDKYGWTSLVEAQIVRVQNGYLIQMPMPIAL